MTFHLVALSAAGTVPLLKKFTQKQLIITFTANMQTSPIGMEAWFGRSFPWPFFARTGFPAKERQSSSSCHLRGVV
jgi:hypothetical protein